MSEESTVSVRIQVLFYSMYGHIYRISEAIVEGAREVALVSQAHPRWRPRNMTSPPIGCEV